MVAELLIGLLAAAETPPHDPAQVPASEWRVVVATPVYHPDGGVLAETTTIASEAPTIVHVYGRRSLCDTASTGAIEPTDASFGWRVTSQTLRSSATETVVTVEWRRLWDRGQKIGNGPAGAVQLTLHPGDRIPLDHIPNPVASDECRAVGMGLDMTLSRTAATPLPDSLLLPMGSIHDGAAPLDADLWLVHLLPAGTTQAHYQRVRLTPAGGTFSFAPVSVSTPAGPVLVEVVGSFRRYRSPAGGEFLYLSMTRSVGGAPLPNAITGGAGTVLALPGADEVLSVEIPSPGRSGGGGGRGGAGSGSGPQTVLAGRGAGGAGSAAGVRVANRPTALSDPDQTSGGARSRGGGGRGGGMGSAMQPAATLLAGHAFSLRLRLTPVTK